MEPSEKRELERLEKSLSRSSLSSPSRPSPSAAPVAVANLSLEEKETARLNRRLSGTFSRSSGTLETQASVSEKVLEPKERKISGQQPSETIEEDRLMKRLSRGIITRGVPESSSSLQSSSPSSSSSPALHKLAEVKYREASAAAEAQEVVVSVSEADEEDKLFRRLSRGVIARTPESPVREEEKTLSMAEREERRLSGRLSSAFAKTK